MNTEYRADFIDRFNVSRETLVRLDVYAELLKKWNPAINLVSKGSVSALWQRHFYDSAQIFGLKSKESCSWADLGSGGGFPGLMLAILSSGTTPDSQFTLVESDVRKSMFLRTVIRELELNAKVMTKRIECIEPLEVDILTARALAPLDKLLEYARQHLKPDGIAVFLKGEKYKAELDKAFVRWRFNLEEIASETNPGGVILKVRGISLV